MDDEFLSSYRQSPSPEFAQVLLATLNRADKARETRRKAVAKRSGLAFAGVCLAITLLMIVSPAARTAARAVIGEIIARIIVKNTTVYVNSDTVDISKLPQKVESFTTVWTPLNPGKISTDYPFLARLPAWVPSGYVLQERAALSFISPSLDHPPLEALFEWKNGAGGILQLSVYKGTCPYGESADDCAGTTSFSVGKNSEPQVITVKDQPGVIFSEVIYLADLSDPVREWNPERGKLVPQGLLMSWEDEGTTFLLMANSMSLSRHDLIRMAESIP
jgi:hypothetical protein